jgi:hypothetical protein
VWNKGCVLEDRKDGFKGDFVNAIEIVDVAAGTEDELKVKYGQRTSVQPSSIVRTLRIAETMAMRFPPPIERPWQSDTATLINSTIS